MADRFQELYRLLPKLYVEGSPVIIEAGALLKDTKTNKVLAQIKIKNLAWKNIISCKISIRAFESNGTELEGIPTFSYLDLHVGLGQEFGSKVPVYLPENITRRMTVSVCEVVFDDGTVWSGSNEEWKQIPVQEAIVERFSDEELRKQYDLEVGNDCAFVPVIQKGLFQCTCGTANLASAERCYKCQRSYESLVSKIDLEFLTAKKDARLQKEAEERELAERAAEAARLAAEEKKRKTKRILKIVLPIAAAIAVVAALTPGVIKPAIDNAIAYHKASELLEADSYDEARAAFEKLGDYRNSADMAMEAQYQKANFYADNQKYRDAIALWTALGTYSDSTERIAAAEADWKEADYQAAVALMEATEYVDASKAFDALGDYKDSPDKSAECLELKQESDYQTALAAVSSGDYKSAITAFKELDSYKDSGDLYVSTSYTYALQLDDSGEYKTAIEYYGNAKGYEDADDRKTEATYNYACQLLTNKKFTDAITQFGKCTGYKDAKSKLLDAKYGYVTSHKSNTDSSTYYYLKDLISAKYSGAQSIYNELYKWKLEITAINTSESSLSNMTSISKYSPIYFHYKVSDGPPFGSTNVTVKYTFPDGTHGTYNMGSETRGNSGTLQWENGIWTNPANGATGTFSLKFYDSDNNQIGSASVRITN